MPNKTKKLEKKLYYPRNNYRTAVKILKLLADRELLVLNDISEKTTGNHQDTKITMEYLCNLGYCSEQKILSNPNYVCANCKSTKFLVDAKSVKSALVSLDKNRMLCDANKSKPNFDPTDYFNCKEGYVLGRLIYLNCKNCNEHPEVSVNDIQFKVLQERFFSLSDLGKYALILLYPAPKSFEIIKKNISNKIFELMNIHLMSGEKLIIKNLINKLKREIHDDENALGRILENWYELTYEKIMKKQYDDELHKPMLEYQKKYYFDYLGKTIQRARHGR